MATVLLVTGIAGCDDGDSAGPEPIGPAVPSTLADGGAPASLPVALHRFRGHPVLGAKELGRDAIPFDPSCRLAGAQARFSEAWLSTEGLTVTYSVQRTASSACDWVIADGRWRLCGGGNARSDDPRRIELAGGGLDFCFALGKRHYRPFMWIAVPRATPWVLVDHYRYWVAYRPAGRLLLRISGLRRAQDFRVKIAFVKETGKVLRERTVRGYTAG